jgi:hypothetical protein
MFNSNDQAPTEIRAQRSTHPTVAALRYGLGWTVAVCTLGATVGLATTAAASDTSNSSGGYAVCVDSLGGMPDAVNQHIDPCRSVDTATAARRAFYFAAVDGR